IYLSPPYTNSSDLSTPRFVSRTASGRLVVGGGLRMLTLDPVSGVSRVRDDYGFFGNTDAGSVAAADPSRSSVAIVDQDELSVYESGSDAFGSQVRLGFYASSIASDEATGGWLVASADHIELRDSFFRTVVSSRAGGGGVTLAPSGKLAYVADASGINVLDMGSLQPLAHLDTG